MANRVVYTALVERLGNLEAALQGSVGLKNGETPVDRSILVQLDGLVQSFQSFLSQNPEFQKFYSVTKAVGIYGNLPVKIQERGSESNKSVEIDEKKKRLIVELELDEIQAMINNVDSILDLMKQVSVIERRETRASFVKLSNLVHDEAAIDTILTNFHTLRTKYNRLLIRSISLLESKMLLLLQQNDFLSDTETRLRTYERKKLQST